MEGEVEGGVVVLDGSEEAINVDVGVELLTDFAPESLCGRFARFDFASRKFPEVFEFAIATLGGEILLLAAATTSMRFMIFVYDAYVKVMIFVESALGAGAFLYGNVDGDGLLPAGERG